MWRINSRPKTDRLPDNALESGHAGSIMAIGVDRRNLRRLNVRPTFSLYLQQLWDRRHFIVTDARFRAFRTAKSYNLWRFWLLAQPLLDAAMYGFIFGVMLKTSRGVDNFLGYVLIGVTFFQFLSSLVNGGQSLVQTSKNLIQTFAFPKATLVLSQSLRYLLDNLPALLIAVTVGLVAQWEKPLSWTIILVLPLTALMWAFGTGLMFIVARITAFLPDFKVLVGLGLRAWFFSSGVFFSLDRFADTPTLHKIFSMNPGYIFLTAVRDSVLYATAPAAETWLTLAAWGFGALLVGLLFFWGAEERYINVRQ